MRLDLTQQKYLHQTLAKLSDNWENNNLSEELRDFALSEGPHHQMMSGELEKAISILTDYATLDARVKQSGSDGWIDDLQTVYLSNKHGVDVIDSFALSVWHDFAKSNAHFLMRGDDIWPTYKILLQLAYEHADDSPVTAAAEEWIAKGHCDWLWLYDAQRPKHFVNNAFRVVYEGHGKSWPSIISNIGNGRFLSWTGEEVIIWEKATGRLITKMEGKKWSNWTSPIQNVLVDQDCKRIAFWQTDHISPYLHDLDDGSLIQQLSTGDQDSTFGGIFLDRKLITWTYSGSDETHACLFLWDTATGNLLHKHEANYPEALADENALQMITSERLISPGLATERLSKQLVVWALDNDGLGELAALHECLPENEQDEWHSFKVLNNQDILGRHQKGLFVFDSQSGRLKAHLALRNILAADLLDDGRVLLRTPQSIKVWSPRCSKANAVRTIHKGTLNSFADVSVCDSGHVWIHAKNGLLWHTHLNGEIPPKSFEISDGWFGHRIGATENVAEYVVTVSVQKIVCIDAKTGNIHYSVDFASSLTGANIFIDGWQSLTWHEDGAIMAWHPDSAFPATIGKHNQPIENAFLISETLAVSISVDGEVKIWRKQLVNWDKEPFALYEVPPNVLNHDDNYRFCANGDLIAIIGDDCLLVRWTKFAGTSPQLLYSGLGNFSFELSENQDEIFVRTSKGELVWINLTAIDPCMRLQAVNEFTFSECKLLNTYSAIVFSRDTGSIGLWDIDQQRLLHWFENPFPENGFNEFLLLAENRVLGFSYSGTLVIWDSLNKSPCLTFQTEKIDKQQILPLQDGCVVVASSSGGSILNPNSNQVLELFTGYPRPERDGESRGFFVGGMLCSPDQASLIIWGGDCIGRQPKEIDDPSYDWHGLLCLNLTEQRRELCIKTQGYPIQASFLGNNKVVTLSQRKRPGKRHCDLELWDLNTGSRIAHRYFESKSLPNMLLTKDGNIFYWTSDLHESQFEWWSPIAGESRELEGHTDSIKDVMPLSEQSVLSWSEQEMIIWDSQTGNILAGPKQFELKIQDIKVTPGVAFTNSGRMFDNELFTITAFGERDVEVNCIASDRWHRFNHHKFYFNMVNLRNDTLLLGYDETLSMTANDASIGESLTLRVDNINDGITGYARKRYVTDENGDEWTTAGDSGFASHIEWVGNVRDILGISGKEAVVLTNLSVVKLRVFNDQLMV